MVRFTLFALLLAALVGIVHSNPLSQESFGSDGPIHTSDSWNYTNCGTPSDIVQIQSLVVDPSPPQPGKNLTIHVSALVSGVIEDGAYADVTVKLGLVKLIQKRFDICEEALKANMSVQCPVQPGSYDVSQTVALPKEIPRAKFTVGVRGYSVDDEELVCLDLKVDFMKLPFPHFRW